MSLAAGARSTLAPRYSINVNDTMHFDIDGTHDRRRVHRYDHAQQRQQRRQRPPDRVDESTTERQRTVVDVVRTPAPPPRPPASRRRRQVPTTHESSLVDVDDGGLFDDDDVFEVRNRDGDDLPRVVRGSILISNSIDTAGTPRHIDVVTGDPAAASGGGGGGGVPTFVVEDNTNMFHGLYRQSRENPIYLSDPDVSPDEAVNSRTYMRSTTRSQRSATKTASVIDDFDRNVRINRGTYSSTNRYYAPAYGRREH